jgi:hypothetical protein
VAVRLHDLESISDQRLYACSLPLTGPGGAAGEA